MKKTVCNFCGKEFDEWDRQEEFSFSFSNVGFGSGFDGCDIEIDLCCDCFDKMMEEYVLPHCSLGCITEHGD